MNIVCIINNIQFSKTMDKKVVISTTDSCLLNISFKISRPAKTRLYSTSVTDPKLEEFRRTILSQSGICGTSSGWEHMHWFGWSQHGLSCISAHYRRQTVNIVFAINDSTCHVAIGSSFLVLKMHEIAQFGKEFRRLGWQLVENQMSNPLNGESSVEMGAFRIEQKVLFTMEKVITSGSHVLIFAVLADFGQIQITAIAPISNTNKVKVRWHKNTCVIHKVFFEIRHHSIDEIIKTIIHRTSGWIWIKPMKNDGHRRGHAGNAAHGIGVVKADVAAVVGAVFVHDGLDLRHHHGWKHDGLSIKLGQAVQPPHSHPRKIYSVRLTRL